jgi:hypothetical protein
MYRSFLFSTGLGERESVMPGALSSHQEIQCRRPQFPPTSNPDYPLEDSGLLVRTVPRLSVVGYERNFLPKATFSGRGSLQGGTNGARLVPGCYNRIRADLPFATKMTGCSIQLVRELGRDAGASRGAGGADTH